MTGILLYSLSALVTNHATLTYYVIRLHGLHIPQSADVRKKVFIMFEIWTFILQKRIDSLKEAFIHPRRRVRHVLLRMHAL